MVKKYVALVFVCLGLLLSLQLGDAAGNDGVPPRVVDTQPANGAASVDASLTTIKVTFSKPMQDKSWSWSYEDKDSFPQMAGEPYYTVESSTTCVLPVKLQPNKRYIIWINTAKHKNFKDKSGIPAEPYKVTFVTGSK